MIEKAKSMIEKLNKLIKSSLKRILRIRELTPNHIIHQIIGDPVVEWNIRNMRIIDSDYLINDEYIRLKKEKTSIQVLRKRLTWECILMASIPYNIIRKCKICKIEHWFEHIKYHISLLYMVI